MKEYHNQFHTQILIVHKNLNNYGGDPSRITSKKGNNWCRPQSRKKTHEQSVLGVETADPHTGSRRLPHTVDKIMQFPAKSFRIQEPREHFLDGANSLARQKQGSQELEASLTHYAVSFGVYLKSKQNKKCINKT